MSVKYECPKCDRRFLDWGAEKLAYQCPECQGVGLQRLGAQEESSAPAPKLKRKPAAKVKAERSAPATLSESNDLAAMPDELEDDEAEEEQDAEVTIGENKATTETPANGKADEDSDLEDTPADLNFEENSTGATDDAFEDLETG